MSYNEMAMVSPGPTSDAQAVEPRTDRPDIGHYYLCRLAGRRPRIGDRALCGHVKVDPRTAEDYSPAEECVVCGDLKRRRFAPSRPGTRT